MNSHTEAYSPDFEKFWAAYPRKKAKAIAYRAWQKAKDMPGIETLIAIITTQKTWPEWQKDHGQYIPYPATWLNGARWEDEPVNSAHDPTQPRTPEPW